MKVVRESDNWWLNNYPIEELKKTSQRVGECGRMLRDREMMYTVDSYTTTESDKIRRVTDYYCLAAKTSHYA